MQARLAKAFNLDSAINPEALLTYNLKSALASSQEPEEEKIFQPKKNWLGRNRKNQSIRGISESTTKMRERRVAEILSEHFVRMGLSPVQRIPVLGKVVPTSRSTIGLVIDVKSRLEVPKSYIQKGVFTDGRWSAARSTQFYFRYRKSKQWSSRPRSCRIITITWTSGQGRKMIPI
jgi:hypothetical protein